MAAAAIPPRERLIAEGATARIYVSRDSQGRPAALKLSRDSACDALLRAEVEAAVRYEHPALLPILGHGEDVQGRAWLLMPLLSGRTLADWRPEAPSLLEALGPIADALDFLHHEGVGHSDLKPANVLLWEQGTRTRLYLSDLGMLSPLGQTSPGGSPAYLSPRRLDGQPLAWEDDLHAFVVLVFEALAGCLPWPADTGDALFRDIRTGRTRALRTRRPELPSGLEILLADSLRSGYRTSSVMAWLDAARGSIMLGPLPRRLYLRASTGGGEGIANRGALSRWLSRHLYSSTTAEISIGKEELRSLEEFARGDVQRLRDALVFLLGRHLLQEHSGQARFSEGATAQLEQLKALLAANQPAESFSRSGWAALLASLPVPLSVPELSAALLIDEGTLRPLVEELLKRGLAKRDEHGDLVGAQSLDLGRLPALTQALPVGLFGLLWERAGTRPGARLLTLGLVVSSGAEGLVDVPPQVDLIDTIDRAPAESCEALASLLRSQELGSAGNRLLGILDVLRLVRTSDLGNAIERYWTIDEGLDLQANAALNRLLFYQLTDSGRIIEARRFLDRWRERHGAEVARTRIEIQIAARELNTLGTYGAQSEAFALAAEYESRFRGREGAWVLHMALANLAHDRGDGLAAIAQAEAALEGLQAEGGEERMELDLLSFLAGAIVHASDRERWSILDGLLERAEMLAHRHEVLSFSYRIDALKGQRLRYRGDLGEARELLVQVRRDADHSGELRRAPYIEGALFIVSLEGGEYQKLLLDLPRLEKAMSSTDRVREVLSFREDILRLRVAVGELDNSLAEAEGLLSAAGELGSQLYLGLYCGLRGRLAALAGDKPTALRELSAGVEYLQAAHALRQRNEYQLELIAADPEADPDGALIAAVIDHEEAVGERRLLPRAWQLEARRLRRAGALRDAALALEEAFRVAATLVSSEHRWPLHVEAAELALAAGDREAARADLERAVAILHDLSLQFTDGAVRERFLARPDRRAVLTRLRSLGT